MRTAKCSPKLLAAHKRFGHKLEETTAGLENILEVSIREWGDHGVKK